MLKYLLFFAMAMLAACTAKDWHNGLKNRQREECYRLPDSQMRQCLQSLDYTYEEYHQERTEGKR